MQDTTQKQEKITFERYYKSLTTAEKKDLKTLIEDYISISHFYSCLRNKKFPVLMREKIEQLTNQTFNWEENEH